jgi:hypothetical protein
MRKLQAHIIDFDSLNKLVSPLQILISFTDLIKSRLDSTGEGMLGECLFSLWRNTQSRA